MDKYFYGPTNIYGAGGSDQLCLSPLMAKQAVKRRMV